MARIWQYQDTQGIWRKGIVHSTHDFGGSDIVYFMQRENGTLDVLSGSRLKAAYIAEP